MSHKRISFGSHFLSNKKRESLIELFNSFDQDSDGKISSAEFNEILRTMNLNNTEAVNSMVIIKNKNENKESELHDHLPNFLIQGKGSE